MCQTDVGGAVEISPKYVKASPRHLAFKIYIHIIILILVKLAFGLGFWSKLSNSLFDEKVMRKLSKGQT